MANRLRKFWDVPTLWPICLSILFGYDVSEIDFGRDFDFFSLVDIFGKRKVAYPDSLQILTSMLQHGFKEVLRHQEDPDSPAKGSVPKESFSQPPTSNPTGRPRVKSMDLAEALQNRRKYQTVGVVEKLLIPISILCRGAGESAGPNYYPANHDPISSGSSRTFSRIPGFRAVFGLGSAVISYRLSRSSQHGLCDTRSRVTIWRNGLEF